MIRSRRWTWRYFHLYWRHCSVFCLMTANINMLYSSFHRVYWWRWWRWWLWWWWLWSFTHHQQQLLWRQQLYHHHLLLLLMMMMMMMMMIYHQWLSAGSSGSTVAYLGAIDDHNMSQEEYRWQYYAREGQL